MKLYLTNIFVNYDIFYQEMKNIGFSEDLPTKIRNINELEIILEDLIDNIIIFNELINIFDYDAKSNYIILNRLKNIGRRKTTLIVNLMELNNNNYSEDESIENGYNDVYLFESENLNQSIGGAVKHITKTTTKGAVVGAASGAVVGGVTSGVAANKTANKNAKKYGNAIDNSDKKSIRNSSIKNGAKEGSKVGAGIGAVGGATAGFVKGVVDVVKGKHKTEPKKLNQSINELALQSKIQYLEQLNEGIKGVIKGAVLGGLTGPVGGAYYGHKAQKYKKENQKLKLQNSQLKINNMKQSINDLALQSKVQYLQELNEGNILKGVDKVLTAGAKILSNKNNAFGRIAKSKLNEGLNIGNTKKAEAKGYKSGSSDGLKVGAVAGVAAVGAGVAAYHGGKALVNKAKNAFTKKPATKKLNQSMQQFIDDGSLVNDYEWDFDEEDEMFDEEDMLIDDGSLVNDYEWDFDEEDEMLFEEDMLFESENLGKPKLSSKQQLGFVKTVEFNGKYFALIKETLKYKDNIILEFEEKGSLSESITDMLNTNENYEWYAKDIVYEDEEILEDFKISNPEIFYLFENFDTLMK